MARRLPLLPTQFCGVDVPLGFDGLSLFVDGNSKITAENGSYELPSPNAFSLPHIATCPGSTETCRETCYVHGLERNAPAVFARYRENERVVHALLTHGPQSFDAREGAKRFGAWIREHCRGGFRWHVSGDVFSADYAAWIVAVANAAPDVNMWIYTRSHGLVQYLVCARNLVVNVSADRDNYASARATADQYQLRVCYEVAPAPYAPNGIICWKCENAPGNPEACLRGAHEYIALVPKDLRPGVDVIFPEHALRARPFVACRVCSKSATEGRHDTFGHDFEPGDTVVPDPESNPFWAQLTPEQRKMICPADMFGQSDSNRCGKSRCSKCLVRAVP